MTFAGVLADPETTIEVARQAASSLLRTTSPAEAFDTLAPWVTTRGTRAQAILWELDAYLTAYSMGDVPVLPDPRWETHCSELATEGNEAMIRESASGVARGLAYYRLPRTAQTPAFSRLSLPDGDEDPPIEPLLVVCFEPPPDWTAPALGSWMPTLYDARPHGVGFVLRLPPDLLVEASRPAAPLDMLLGMPVLYFELRCRPWEGPRFWALPQPRAVEQGRFSRAHVDELRAVAALAGRSALRMVVMSANTD